MREDSENDDEEELLENGEAIRRHNRWKEVLELMPEVLAIRQEERMLARPSNT
jgi:DNA-directed RNA polymerase beta' subunit